MLGDYKKDYEARIILFRRTIWKGISVCLVQLCLSKMLGGYKLHGHAAIESEKADNNSSSMNLVLYLNVHV